jgi:ParB/RepB/Spo0J family partition protein
MEIVQRRVAELRAHQLQAETYGDLPPNEFEELKGDIADRGVRQPIEVTQDGIIVDGHQRVRACRELGIEVIDAIICQDHTQDDIDESFVLGNLMRRHLDPIAIAKALERLVAIERRRNGVDSDRESGDDLRDRIAKRLGGKFSGRTIDRYLQLLRLPAAIRQAVSRKDLSMAQALVLERLKPETQDEIASRITAGESVRTVVAAYLPRKRATQEEAPADLYRMLIEFLDENIEVLESTSHDLAGKAGKHDVTTAVLEKTEVFCKAMRTLESKARQESLDFIRRMLG